MIPFIPINMVSAGITSAKQVYSKLTTSTDDSRPTENADRSPYAQSSKKCGFKSRFSSNSRYTVDSRSRFTINSDDETVNSRYTIRSDDDTYDISYQSFSLDLNSDKNTTKSTATSTPKRKTQKKTIQDKKSQIKRDRKRKLKILDSRPLKCLVPTMGRPLLNKDDAASFNAKWQMRNEETEEHFEKIRK